MQELAKYGVHEILASLQPHVEADQHAQVLEDWLIFQWEVGQIEVNHAPTTSALDQRVKPEEESQSKWRMRYGVLISPYRIRQRRSFVFCSNVDAPLVTPYDAPNQPQGRPRYVQLRTVSPHFVDRFRCY